MKSAEKMIKAVYGESENFMTPNIKEYGWIVPQEVAYELSTGKGIINKYLAGVSIVEGNKKSKKSKCLNAETEEKAVQKAKEYIQELKERIN